MNPPRIVVPDAIPPTWTMPSPLRTAARAFAVALFRTQAALPPEERIEWLLDELEDYLGRAGARTQLVFGASMTAITTLAPLTIGRPPPLGSLPTMDRVHAIEKFEQTPLGLAVLGAKATLCFLWYEHPDVMREVRIDTACLTTEATS